MIEGLDLFSGDGGAGRGYELAGIRMTGIDNRPMRHYRGTRFILADALEYLAEHGQDYDFIHASPPCHEYSTGTRHRKNAGIVYPDLLGPTQEVLRTLGRPYVIENVPGAAQLMRDPFMLCGGMFGLGVMRHRWFESNLVIVPPVHLCNGSAVDRDEMSVTRHGPPARWYRKHPGRVFSITRWHEGMGIDWMPRATLTQAIPPAYTRFIGERAVALLEGQAG